MQCNVVACTSLPLTVKENELEFTKFIKWSKMINVAHLLVNIVVVVVIVVVKCTRKVRF